MASPTSRTLALLKKEGWQAAIVEKWNPHARIPVERIFESAALSVEAVAS